MFKPGLSCFRGGCLTNRPQNRFGKCDIHSLLFNDNNNNDRIERHSSRFLQSPHCTANCFQHVIIIIIITINLIYIAQFDTNRILTALYIVITYIQMQYVHVCTYAEQSYKYTYTCLHIHRHMYNYTSTDILTRLTIPEHYLYTQVAMAQPCQSPMQHIKRLSHTTCHVSHDTKGQFSY